ncbi:hypothetical protein AGABI1DRAFT_120846 [Agaricus bisporus var. burnettii JB137-S8]|uniref:Uncharacterized protein n=1 Tax=Agaricus bisporus var. burnettii (strain JB137-S8 / ATCC MYA-4627 / FGSC 10392) TaxID=597362 RepID=K5VY85_AGABU|nr:uncharacterized protein AGABI1DRAFT_120846 [Agaricus bisporus var. burnettii JB137-S8]EKM79449.1 hypothetical protein AGABI1DRAFT_120846 [Agaricus bisporus var. burnettii JB137-S8]
MAYEKDRSYATFERHDEYVQIQNTLVNQDLFVEPDTELDKKEVLLVSKLSVILNDYQEQSYLLDPFLESLLSPVINKFKGFVHDYSNVSGKVPSTRRVERLCLILYGYVKFRGYKIIVRFFPHEIADLPIALNFMLMQEGVVQHHSLWALRYIMMLWLSLVSMLPFDLAQFDDESEPGHAARSLELIGKTYLGKAGLERDGAALLLSRLYMRKDIKYAFPEFAIGSLQVINEIVKSGSVDQVLDLIPEYLEIIECLNEGSIFVTNTILRKLRAKLISRMAVRMLPPPRVRKRGRMLDASLSTTNEHETGIGEHEIPEVVETLLQYLFDCLQDKALYFDLRKGSHSIGSNVRDAAAYVLWSLARSHDLTSLQPYSNDLARKLVTVALFDREIHIRRAASAAFQEHVGRTGLFPHGIDVLRKTDFYAISSRQHAFIVAAPQVAEHLEYRPYLIDHLLQVVLRHWDVGMREIGSKSLREICKLNLLELGPSMTRRTTELLKSYDICDVQGALLALSETSAAYRDLDDPEIRDRLLREVSLSPLYKFELSLYPKTFSYLSFVDKDVIFGSRNGTVVAAACQLIGNAITLAEIELKERSSVLDWKKIIDHGLRYRLETVQAAAAAAYAAISEREDLSDDIRRLIKDLKSGLPIFQQSLANVLGLIDYNKCQRSLSPSLGYLLDQTKASSRAAIEVRRNSYRALPRILHTLSHNLTNSLSPPMVQSIIDSLLSGLNDYTIDERGDVGSWVRIACVQGLTSCISDLFAVAASVENFEEYLPLPKYQHAVAGILKQGVERLDNVRQEAGICFSRLLRLPPVKSGECVWSLPGLSLFEENFSMMDTTLPSWLARESERDEPPDWANGAWLFPRAVKLVTISEFQPLVLKGLISSIGCKTEGTHRPAAKSMSAFAKSLPASNDEGYSLTDLLTDVMGVARANATLNSVVVPVLQTLTILLEADALLSLVDTPLGVKKLSALLDLVTRNVGRFKNVQRIQESMKITVNLIAIEVVSRRAISCLSDFLVHPYPRIRADTAEYLYLFLQGTDALEIEEEAEEILLETEWSSDNAEVAKNASQRLLVLLLASAVVE